MISEEVLRASLLPHGEVRTLVEAQIVAWLRSEVEGFHRAAKEQGKRVGPLAAGYSQAATTIERGEYRTPPVTPSDGERG